MPDGIAWCGYEHRAAIREHSSTYICGAAPATVDLIHYISTNVLFILFLTETFLVSGIQGSTKYLVIVREVWLVLKSLFLVQEGTLASRLNFAYICLLCCS